MSALHGFLLGFAVAAIGVLPLGIAIGLAMAADRATRRLRGSIEARAANAACGLRIGKMTIDEADGEDDIPPASWGDRPWSPV